MTCEDYDRLASRPLTIPPTMAEIGAAVRHMAVCPACTELTRSGAAKGRAGMTPEELSCLDQLIEQTRRRYAQHIKTDPEAVR